MQCLFTKFSCFGLVIYFIYVMIQVKFIMLIFTHLMRCYTDDHSRKTGRSGAQSSKVFVWKSGIQYNISYLNYFDLHIWLQDVAHFIFYQLAFGGTVS